MRRLVSAVWSGFWLLVLLAAAPAGLVYVTRRVLPADWSTVQQWAVSGQPAPHWLVASVLVGLGWSLWALVAGLLIREAVRRLRRAIGWLRGKPLPPLPTPMQATASGMIGAAVFGMPTGILNTPPVPHPTAIPGPAGPTTDQAQHSALNAPVQPPTTAAAESEPAGERLGVQLPERGWLDGHTARLVASAASMVWWQRRRRYIPHVLAGPVREDPDLVALPPTVDAVRVALQPDQTAPRSEAAQPGDAAGPSATALPIGELPAVLTAHQLPPGGVGLSGPGAPAAARGLLVTTALSALPGHQLGEMQLLTTTEDVRALLGPNAEAQLPIPGMAVASSLEDLIAVLEQRIRRRARARLVPADEASRLPDGGGETPPVVVITHVPHGPGTAARVAQLLNNADHDVAGMLLGTWPRGPTWYVDPDGHAHEHEQASPIGRWCVLSSIAAIDLLAAVRQAAPTDQDTPPSPHVAFPTAAKPRIGADTTNGSPVVLPGRAHSGSARLWLRLLGPPTLYRTVQPLTPVAIQRSAALQILAFLAVHPRGATSEQLIAALWPGPRPKHAGNRLYTPAAKLRATLRDGASAEVLIRDSDRYRLDPTHINVDLWQLHTLVDRASTTLEPTERLTHLHAIVDGYTDDLAAGKDWPWLDIPRESTRRHVIDAYLTLAHTAPDEPSASAFLQAALRIDPANTYLQNRVSRTLP